MFDNYTHEEYGIIYVDENIPGPKEISTEYENISESFNSQLTHNCRCIEKCEEEICNCLKISGGTNYISLEEKKSEDKVFVLSRKKNVNNFPVIECCESCKCYQLCGNRLVQNGPIKNLLVKHCKNELKGLGLFINTHIPVGTFICEYAGEVITKFQALSRHQYNQANGEMNYIFCLREHGSEGIVETFIDPSKFGNIGRYVNHSCEPNCEIIPVRVDSPIPKLAIFNSSAILPDTEITIDYGANSPKDSVSDEISVRIKCLCGSRKCKGFIPYDCY